MLTYLPHVPHPAPSLDSWPGPHLVFPPPRQVAAPALEELVEKLCGELMAVADRIDMERERMEKLVG